MPKFEFGVREVWIRRIIIEANDRTEAEQLVRRECGVGAGRERGEMRYCYMLNSETWEFKEISNGSSH